DRDAYRRNERSERSVRRQGDQRRRARRLPACAGQRDCQCAADRSQRNSGDAGPHDGGAGAAPPPGAPHRQRAGRAKGHTMSMLADGHVTRPATVEDAIAAWCQTPGSRYIAGGTDLVVNIRRGITRPNLLVDLSGIEDLNALVAGPAGVTIGTGVTIAALARNPEIASRYRAVAQAAESIAGPGHRNVATVGGNLCLDTRCVYYNQSEWWRSANNYCLKNQGDTCHVAPQGERCHAAFSGDLAPALIALNATVDIEGARGPRRIPLADLYVEDGKAHLALDPGELVVAVNLPLATQVSAYQKVRTRGAIDFPLAGVAVALTVAEKK